MTLKGRCYKYSADAINSGASAYRWEKSPYPLVRDPVTYEYPSPEVIDGETSASYTVKDTDLNNCTITLFAINGVTITCDTAISGESLTLDAFTSHTTNITFDDVEVIY